MKRSLTIAALVIVILGIIGVGWSTYTDITSADAETRQGIEEADAALEEYRRLQQEREQAE